MQITHENLMRFSNAFHNAPNSALMQHALTKNSIEALSENYLENVANPMLFSIEIESGKITDQKGSGRCWLFAGLNTLRFVIMKKLDLETFELSQNYQMFFDKLEKANYFFDSILKTLDEPQDSRLIQHLISSPVQDGGQWDMFCALVDKYGCVPKDVMPETFHSSSTGGMNNFLTLKLREDAMELREAHKAGATADELSARIEGYMNEVYRILCLCLGEPPCTFSFQYKDKDKKYHCEPGMTAHSFYEKYIGRAMSEYVSIINAPTEDKPYGKTFTVAFLGNVLEGRKVKYLNLPSADLKRLAIAQLSDGEPVWFGCDVGKYLMRDKGLMGLNTYDYGLPLGVRFGMNKAQRLDYASSAMTHAMVFLGVNLVDGKPNRWKVENSWSEKAGQDGYYIMTDEWFDEYNYQIVVNRKYLSEEQKAMFDQEPIELKPWDPMGSLA